MTTKPPKRYYEYEDPTNPKFYKFWKEEDEFRNETQHAIATPAYQKKCDLEATARINYFIYTLDKHGAQEALRQERSRENRLYTSEHNTTIHGTEWHVRSEAVAQKALVLKEQTKLQLKRKDSRAPKKNTMASRARKRKGR